MVGSKFLQRVVPTVVGFVSFAIVVMFSTILAYEYSPTHLRPSLFLLWVGFIAVVSWGILKWLRNAIFQDGYLRFSVKSMLVLVLVICVLLATVGRRIHDVTRQTVALIRIRSAGGQISGHNSDPRIHLHIVNFFGCDQ